MALLTNRRDDVSTPRIAQQQRKLPSPSDRQWVCLTDPTDTSMIRSSNVCFDHAWSHDFTVHEYVEFNAQDFRVSGQLQTIESPPPRVSVRADAVCRFNLNPVGRASCGQDGTARVKTGPWRRKFRQSENEYYYLTVTGHQVSAGKILWMTSRSHEFI